MKLRFFALFAAIMLVGSALMAAPATRAGIGLSWGVGYETFNDSRFIGVSQMLSVTIKLDKQVTLSLDSEQQAVAYDDAGTDEDGLIQYTGFSLTYSVGAQTSVGIGMGKADIDIGGEIEQTVPYADIIFGLNLLSGSGDKIDYNVGLSIKYRMVEIDDYDISGDDTETLSGTQFALNVGLVF